MSGRESDENNIDCEHDPLGSAAGKCSDGADVALTGSAFKNEGRAGIYNGVRGYTWVGVENQAKYVQSGGNMAVEKKIRIRIKSYDHQLVDSAAEKIVETAKRTGARVSGPIPLPTDKEIITILRAVHKYKDSREQFEMRTHKRLIDILRPSNKTVEALTSLQLPAGVDIEIKL